MGSIGSTLNSINSSLLTEIQSFSGTGTSTGTTTSTSSAPTSDRVDLSQTGELIKQLQQLQTSNPTEFKQVLTDAVAKFKDAASQETDPKAAAFLNSVADRFQKAADTSDVSALAPPQGAGGAHGHHGHHGGAKKADSDSADPTDPTLVASSIADPTASATSTDPLSAALSQIGQDSYNLVSGQNGSNNTDVLAAAFSSLQTASTPGSPNDQITNLLNSFVTSTA